MNNLPPYCTYRARVAFHETDAARIVHFAQYLRYAELAETQALHGCGLLASLMEKGMGMPRVKLDVEYKSPLRFWEEYEVRAQLERIGESSLHWSFIISGEKSVAARVSWVTARLNAHGAKAVYSAEEKEILTLLIPSL